MKRFKKMTLSAPGSRTVSRTSSEASLDIDIDIDVDGLNDFNINGDSKSDDIPDIEPNMPSDTKDIPAYYKDFTMGHPLGNLLMRMSSLNTELCKKLNIKSSDNPDLSEVCSRFVDAIRLERGRNSNKLNKVSSAIEDSILNKELNFHSINASVQAPEYFSPIPVLTTAAKMQEAMKVFPTKTSQKFSGTYGTVTIIEFLNSLNSAQKILNLSKKEFMIMLQKCVTGKVYTMVSDSISYDLDIGDLYNSLLTLYDTRMTSANARKLLNNYKAQRNQTLAKVQSQIMMYASRIASQVPAGPSRTAMFNLEANNGLIRSLPPHSADTVTNVVNTLAAKLQQSPSFVQTIKCLTKYNDTIDLDIAKNGVSSNKLSTDRNRSNVRVYALDRRSQTGRASFSGRQRPQSYVRNSNYEPIRKRGLIRERVNVNALQYKGNPYGDSPRQERVYNMNNNRRTPYNRQSGRTGGGRNDQNQPFKGRYCVLCGSRSHSASDLCFRMRDSANRPIEVIPSFFPCDTCYKLNGKKLYHPPEFCYNKPKKTKDSTEAKKD